MKKLIVLLACLPLLGQNYASYATYPVARMSFLRSQTFSGTASILGDSTVLQMLPISESIGATAYDLSGKKNISTWGGVPSGSKGFYTTGKTAPFCGAMNGVNNYILNSVIENTSVGTVAGWIFVPSLPSSNSFILGFAQGNSAGFYDKDIYIDSSGHLFFFVYIGYDVATTVPSQLMSTSVWHHVAGTFNGNLLTMYLDGIAIGTATAVGSSYTNYTAPNLLGGGYTFSGSLPLGYVAIHLCDLRYYNRVLSQAEIQAIYNAENH